MIVSMINRLSEIRKYGEPRREKEARDVTVQIIVIETIEEEWAWKKKVAALEAPGIQPEVLNLVPPWMEVRRGRHFQLDQAGAILIERVLLPMPGLEVEV